MICIYLFWHTFSIHCYVLILWDILVFVNTLLPLELAAEVWVNWGHARIAAALAKAQYLYARLINGVN